MSIWFKCPLPALFNELCDRRTDCLYRRSSSSRECSPCDRLQNWIVLFRGAFQPEWWCFYVKILQKQSRYNFTNPALINPKSTGQIIFKQKSKILASHKFCDGEKCRHFNSSKAEDICRAKKRVIKTIKPARIDVLLKEAERRNVDLRVIIYLR